MKRCLKGIVKGELIAKKYQIISWWDLTEGFSVLGWGTLKTQKIAIAGERTHAVDCPKCDIGLCHGTQTRKAVMDSGKVPSVYIVEKKFIGGFLDGLTISEMTNVKYPLGFVCEKPVGGSPYKIISIVKA